MLGKKESCGLIFIFCCSLACPLPLEECYRCLSALEKSAETLPNAIRNFFGVPDGLYSIITDQLPSCASSLNATDIVKAFHTLFSQLKKTIEGAAEIKILEENLRQQEVCLDHWKVENSSIKLTYDKNDETARKILLVKSSERYKCLMLKLLKDCCN